MPQRESEISRSSNAVGRDGLGWRDCQYGAGRDGLAGPVAWGIHRGMIPLMRLALALSFKHVRVRHGERMPRTGAILLVANHPSTWTDVVLLDSLLGRRLHFLAQDEQFHPWPRRVLLELFGTLPLSSIEHRPDAVARNEATFRRCEKLFDRREAVAVFPEGISLVDRGLLPLKHGAARLALSYVARRGDRRLSLVPVGIHYSDRTAFRSDVTVSVGRAIPVETWRSFDPCDLEAAASRVTENMEEAMRGLVLEGMDPPRARLFSVMESVVAGRMGSLELETARLLARSLADETRNHPGDVARLERHARAYRRIRNALGVSDPALAERSRAERAGAILGIALGFVPALAGMGIHALPGALTRAATRRYIPQPSQVAFARIGSGFLFFSLTYGAGILLLVGTRVPHAWIPGIVLLCLLLGAVALEYAPRARLESERWRIAWISRRHGRLIRRVRRERCFLCARAIGLLQ